MPSAYYTVDDKTGELEIVRTVGLTEEEVSIVVRRAVQFLDKGNVYFHIPLSSGHFVQVGPAFGSPYWGAEAVKETAM